MKSWLSWTKWWCPSHNINKRNGNDPVLDLNVYVIDVDCCWWKHIINDIFLTDSQRERDKIVKMTKTLNDPSVFTLRVWETLSTICQEIFFRTTQMIYIVAKSRLRRDENGSTLQFWDILVIKTLLLNLILMLVLINSPTTDRIQKWFQE